MTNVERMTKPKFASRNPPTIRFFVIRHSTFVIKTAFAEGVAQL